MYVICPTQGIWWITCWIFCWKWFWAFLWQDVCVCAQYVVPIWKWHICCNCVLCVLSIIFQDGWISKPSSLSFRVPFPWQLWFTTFLAHSFLLWDNLDGIRWAFSITFHVEVKELRHKVTSPPLPLLAAKAKRILNGSASVLSRVDLIILDQWQIGSRKVAK